VPRLALTHRTVTKAPLRSWLGTSVFSLRPLASSPSLGIMPSSRSPQFSPSGLLTHLRMGSVQMPHHNLTTQTKSRGYDKSRQG
jgi:hypothetical protein